MNVNFEVYFQIQNEKVNNLLNTVLIFIQNIQSVNCRTKSFDKIEILLPKVDDNGQMT